MFNNLITVEIFLYKGDHYLLENRFDALNIYHKKLMKDDFSLNQNLIIRPLDCDGETYAYTPGCYCYNDTKTNLLNCTNITSSSSCMVPVNQTICTQPTEKVTVYNKIRERLNFKVFAFLKLERIVIDSIDSILPQGTSCLSERRRCC
jgi:hypothetical protein